jgi:hypothetical protein
LFSPTITTLLPDLPAMNQYARPYSPIHFEPKELERLAKARLPFWVMMTLKNPINSSVDPINGAVHLLRYPGVKFDLEVHGASSNLRLSGLRLIAAETHTDAVMPTGALVGAIGQERLMWRWTTPFIIPAHTPLRLEVRYNDLDGPVENHQGWVVLHGVRLERRK